MNRLNFVKKTALGRGLYTGFPSRIELSSKNFVLFLASDAARQDADVLDDLSDSLSITVSRIYAPGAKTVNLFTI
jgi:hypothetical protein